jgi:hypothetical protein
VGAHEHKEFNSEEITRRILMKIEDDIESGDVRRVGRSRADPGGPQISYRMTLQDYVYQEVDEPSSRTRTENETRHTWEVYHLLLDAFRSRNPQDNISVKLITDIERCLEERSYEFEPLDAARAAEAQPFTTNAELHLIDRLLDSLSLI